jgi:hypothetical protein
MNSVTYKRQTRPLVREGAPQRQDVVSLKMEVGENQASGYPSLERRKDGAGHQRIDIRVVEEYRNI